MARVLPPMPPLDGRSRWVLGGLLAIGALLRIIWGFAVAEAPAPGTDLHDPVLYLILGDNVAQGNGFSYGPEINQGASAFYPPGYPLVLGAVFKLGDLLPGNIDNFDLAIAFNVVLSVATIAVVFSLGRRLVNPMVGLIAAGIFAFWPNLIVYTGVFLTETLFLFLFSSMLLVALASPEVTRAPGRWRMLTVGLLFGAAGMVRPISFVLAPLFLLLWWRAGAATAVKRTALVGAAVLAMVIPWTVRNASTMDSFVLVSTNFGDNMCIGNHPGATGAYEIPSYCNLGFPGDASNPACYEQYDPAEAVPERCRRPEVEIDRQNENVDLALRHIRDEPLAFFTKMPAKLRWTLDRDTDGLWGATNYGQQSLLSPGNMDRLELASNAYYTLIGVVGAAGAVLLMLRADSAGRRRFFVLAALIQLVPPMVTFGDARFKMPIYPALAVGAAVAVVALLERRLPETDVVADTAGGSAPGGSEGSVGGSGGSSGSPAEGDGDDGESGALREDGSIPAGATRAR